MNMSSINKVQILGNLGADPDLRFTPGGTAVCNLRIATTERWTDKNTGEKQERTEWHRITVWGKSAENCGRYLSKGRRVMVEGKLRTRSYEKDGVRHYITEIQATPGGVQFLDGGKKPAADEMKGQDETPPHDLDDVQPSVADTDIPV